MKKPSKPNKYERDVLDVVLGELRRAMRLRGKRAGGQLTIVIDPWVAGFGTNIFAAPSEVGRTYSIVGSKKMCRGKK